MEKLKTMSELIKISKEFKGAMGGVWLGKEVEIPDGADDIVEFIKQNERLEKAWMAMNNHINWNESSQKENSVIQVKRTPDIESLFGIIKMADKPKWLEGFRPQIEKANNPELTEAFNNKLKSFE